MIHTLPREIRELYPFAPHWVDVGGRMLHYLDDGLASSAAVLLLHGNPTWSFLYRKIIPTVTGAGYRVIAPDFLGCGRSDHAIDEDEYAIVHHVARTLAVLDHAGVHRVVAFLAEWGGPIAFGMELTRPGLLTGLVLGNTFWGEASAFHRRVFPWRTIHAPVAGPLLFARRQVFVNGLRLSGPPEIHDGPAWRAYTLPNEAHGGSAGATLAWPRAISLGPGHPTHPLAEAIWRMLPALDVPVRFVWGGADVVFPPAEQGEALRHRLPRGKDHDMVVIDDARHFIQEYAPAECADALIAVAGEVL